MTPPLFWGVFGIATIVVLWVLVGLFTDSRSARKEPHRDPEDL